MGKGVSIRIGTSGWSYKHWDKIFYPDKWPKSRWLEYYAEHFDNDFEGYAVNNARRLMEILGVD